MGRCCRREACFLREEERVGQVNPPDNRAREWEMPPKPFKKNNPEANEPLGFSPVSPHLKVVFINTRLSNVGRSVCVYPGPKKIA